MMKHIPFAILLAAVLLSACTKSGDSPAPENDRTDPMARTLQIRTEMPMTEDEVKDILEAAGYRAEVSRLFPENPKFASRHRQAGLDLWYSVTMEETAVLTKAAVCIEAIDGIAMVEMPEPAKSMSLPFNDPYLSRQWYLANLGKQQYQRKGIDLNIYDAWNITTGSPDVIVCINDEGAEVNHPDLKANNWVNLAELNGTPGIDDDGNGYVDDIYGYNFVGGFGSLIPNDHGTHVAGTIAAVNNNDLGVCGIAGGDGSENSGVKLMYCQTMENKSSALAAPAFVYAADNGAVISQNSWGFVDPEVFPASLKAAIDYFIENAGLDENGNQIGPMAGGVVIFAAGNEDSQVNRLSAYDRIISVAALGPDGTKAYYSNFGEWVDIAAPGGDAYAANNYQGLIYNTITNGAYGPMQGTSMACPQVSGVAALMVSHFGGPGYTADMLKERLLATANPVSNELNPRYPGKLGVGMVDALAALKTGGDQSPEAITDLDGSTEGNTITLEWTIPSDPDSKKPYATVIFMSDQPLDDEGTNATRTDTVKVHAAKAGSRMAHTYESLRLGQKYHFRAYSYDIDGNRSIMTEDICIATKGSNRPPVITAEGPTAITIKKHETGTIVFDVSDPDGDIVRCRLETAAGSGITMKFEGTKATITIQGQLLKAGTYAGTIYAADKFDEESASEFSVTVLENNPPVMANKIENILSEKIGESFSLDLTQYVEDPDGETLSYSVKSSTQNGPCEFNLRGTILSLRSARFGSQTFIVTAGDASGANISLSFDFVCRDGNEILDIYPVPVTEILNLRASVPFSSTVEIYGPTGARVYKEDVDSTPFIPAKLNLKALSAGKYTLVTEINGTPVKKAFIKK